MEQICWKSPVNLKDSDRRSLLDTMESIFQRIEDHDSGADV